MILPGAPIRKKVKEYLCFYDEKVDLKFEGYWQRPLNLLRHQALSPQLLEGLLGLLQISQS
ncbi:MAG: hypothetical protein M3274_02495, partial [Actinomycetota bacterium]|nr:hypothetical protein [Actinomycetota bacterium]